MKPYFVDHIEFQVTDLNKAKEFYGKIFGWKDIMMDYGETYVLVSLEDPNWPSFGISKVDKIENNNSIVVTMRVDDIPKALKTITAAGGEVVKEMYEIAPEIGHAANFKDIFGNVWGLHSQPKV
jgi:uncharacterized protein